MFEKVMFILVCLLIPVLWGIAVNWMFEFWKTPKPPTMDGLSEEEPIFPDYQI